MLDECKGERFEMLLARFAMLVLRKVTEKQKGLSIVTKALLDGSQGPPNVVSLSVAYRNSLRTQLESRRQLVSQLSHQQQSLHEQDDEITQRKHRVWTALSKISQEDHSCSVDSLTSSWSADPRWITVLLSDEPTCSNGGSLFNTLMPSSKDPSDSGLPDEAFWLMTNLDTRIQQHESKLEEWRIYQSSHLSAEQPQKAPEKNLSISSHGIWSMDMHQHLTALQTQKDVNRLADNTRADMPPECIDLLERMNCELKTSRGSLLPVKVASPQSGFAQTALQPLHNTQGKTSASTAVKPNTYTPNKQHECLHESSAISASTTLSQMIQRANTSECSGPAKSTGSTTSSPPLVSMNHQTGASTSKREEEYRDARSTVGKFQSSILSDEDRTGMSMENVRGTNLDKVTPPELGGNLSKNEHGCPSPAPNSPTHLTLADRTRQSMSLLDKFPATNSQSRRARTSKLCKHYRVNQVQTSHGHSMQQMILTSKLEEPPLGEDLFSDQADEASVFKSRVKVALSPLVTPERSMLDDNLIGLNLRENGDNFSR